LMDVLPVPSEQMMMFLPACVLISIPSLQTNNSGYQRQCSRIGCACLLDLRAAMGRLPITHVD
jgi:hypothetical protein